MNRVAAMVLAMAAGFLGGLAPPSARACEVALLLTMDVSGSVDRGEYLMQTEGLATALIDPQIADALVAGQTALAVMQWSGVGQQDMSMRWRRMLAPADVIGFAGRVRLMPRVFQRSDTAVGDAIRTATAQFEAVADCRRRVIDISGDGAANAGLPPQAESQRAQAAAIAINGIAIESAGESVSVSEFYRRLVITRSGFVVTARGHLDYARAIQAKLLREVVKPGS